MPFRLRIISICSLIIVASACDPITSSNPIFSGTLLGDGSGNAWSCEVTCEVDEQIIQTSPGVYGSKIFYDYTEIEQCQSTTTLNDMEDIAYMTCVGMVENGYAPTNPVYEMVCVGSDVDDC